MTTQITASQIADRHAFQIYERAPARVGVLGDVSSTYQGRTLLQAAAAAASSGGGGAAAAAASAANGAAAAASAAASAAGRS